MYKQASISRQHFTFIQEFVRDLVQSAWLSYSRWNIIIVYWHPVFPRKPNSEIFFFYRFNYFPYPCLRIFLLFSFPVDLRRNTELRSFIIKLYKVVITRVSKTVSILKEQTDLHDYRRSKVVYLETSVSSITMILWVFSL